MCIAARIPYFAPSLISHLGDLCAVGGGGNTGRAEMVAESVVERATFSESTTGIIFGDSAVFDLVSRADEDGLHAIDHRFYHLSISVVGEGGAEGGRGGRCGSSWGCGGCRGECEDQFGGLGMGFQSPQDML